MEKIQIDKALKLLKAGYNLYTINNHIREEFSIKDSYIIIKSENKSIKINSYDFLSIYKDTFFYIKDDESIETVDIKKDEEYYSWRQ